MNNINPLVSVVIPSFDGHRGGCLPKLLENLREQSFKDFEVIVITGDKRQGRAINNGVRKSKGSIIIILDDDTILGHKDVFKNLVSVIENNSTVGMAGVSNLVPENASFFVKRAMREIPRRSSELVEDIVDSDMAEHPCCAIPKKVFWEVGGESEVIPRGLDPYLRHKIRSAGYRVVVIPNTWIHHLLPDSFLKIIKRSFKNGKTAAYCNKFYPNLIYDQAHSHLRRARKKLSRSRRLFRYLGRMCSAFITLKWIYLFVQIFNALGFAWGWLFLKKDEI